MNFRMSFKDTPHSDFLEQKAREMSDELSREFPETLRYEITHTHSGDDRSTHLHVMGKHVDLAASADSRSARESVNEAFVRMRAQLRKHHDKVIFNRRREGE